MGRKKSDEPEKKKDSPEKKKVRFFGRNKSDPKEPEDEVKDPEAETNGKETTAESETEKEDSASEDEESDKYKYKRPAVCAAEYNLFAISVHQAQHAVLIGTGIGVTPYASILQSIMHR